MNKIIIGNYERITKKTAEKCIITEKQSIYVLVK